MFRPQNVGVSKPRASATMSLRDPEAELGSVVAEPTSWREAPPDAPVLGAETLRDCSGVLADLGGGLVGGFVDRVERLAA